MKKLISLALCLAMVLTIFTINASALVETGVTEVVGAVPETVYVGQDYSDIINNTAFTETFGDATITFNAGVGQIDTSTLTANSGILYRSEIGQSNYTFEFDIRPDYIDGTASMVNIYLYEADCYIRIKPNKNGGGITVNTGVWYTFQFTVADNVVTSGKCGVKGEELIDLVNTGTGNPQAVNQYRVVSSASDNTGIAFYAGSSKLAYSLDNIKVYQPGNAGIEVFTEYQINEGNIVMTAKDVTEYVPNAVVADATKNDKVDFSYGTGAATGGQIVILVDLKNTVAGMPISVAASSTGTDYGNIFSTHIMSNADIVGAWYTYKILFNAATNRATAVYRRPAEGGEWTALALGTDYIQGTKDDRFGTYKPDAAKAAIGYSGPMSSNLVTGTTVADTRWSSRNLQVIDGYAFAGTKTIADGKITLNLNAGIYGAASAILAVYDGNKLADAKYVDLAATAETATVAADYAEGNKVVLYVWDSLANAKPIMLTPYTVVE